MNLEMFYPMHFFVDLQSYGVLEQIKLCCANGNLGQFFNLHTSKMKSGCHINNFAFKPLVLECCVIPSFGGTHMRRIHLWRYFVFQIKVKFKIKCEISVDNQ